MSVLLASDIDEICTTLGAEAQAFSGKRILITGARGFLGRYMSGVFARLNAVVLKTPCEVIELDNMVTAGQFGSEHTDDRSFAFVQHDVVKPFYPERPVHYVLHLAGIASPFYYRKWPLETLEVATTGLRAALALDAADLERLSAAGREFGIAFQLIDDLLDILGTALSAGKPSSGSDITAGVYTLPVILELRTNARLRVLLDSPPGERLDAAAALWRRPPRLPRAASDTRPRRLRAAALRHRPAAGRATPGCARVPPVHCRHAGRCKQASRLPPATAAAAGLPGSAMHARPPSASARVARARY